MRRIFLLAALLYAIAAASAQTGNTTIQPDCLIPFTLAAAGNFPATTVAGGPGDNRTKGCAAWTLMYQNTGMTSVTVTLQSASTTGTTPSFGSFAGTISTGYVNPIVSDTGGSVQATNGTADISWVRVNVAATGTGTLTGVLYGFRNSSAAVTNQGGTVTSIATGCFLTGGPITTTGTISASETVNAQTGTTYAILNSDCGKLVTGTNAGSEAYSIAQAGGGGNFAAGWFLDLQNRGAGTLTLTPATSTVDGAATLILASGEGRRIVSDGANYFTEGTSTGTGFVSPSGSFIVGDLITANATNGSSIVDSGIVGTAAGIGAAFGSPSTSCLLNTAGGCSTVSSSFTGITSGTNTVAAMIIGTGATLGVSYAGLGAAQTNGFYLFNTTAAAAGAQQWAPALQFEGQGWKTTSTAASQAVDFRVVMQTIQGSAAPSGLLAIQSSINGGAYNGGVTFGTNGGISALSGFIYSNNGGQIGLNYFGSNYVSVQSVGVYAWHPSTDITASPDTGQSRLAAGVVAFGTGAQGSVAGGFQATAEGTIAVLTSNLKACSAGGATPTGLNSYSAAVSDAVAPAIGVALTGGGTVWSHVHCSLTTGTYLVDGI